MKKVLLFGLSMLVAVSSLFIPVLANNKGSIKGNYLGEKRPGCTPREFGPNLSWFKDKYVQDIAISPDGKEICFVICSNLNGTWNDFTTYYTKRDRKGYWSKPVKAPFTGDLQGAFRPFFSPDGNKVAFISQEPRDIWMSNRVGDEWSDPVKMDPPINTESIENTVSIGPDNSIFICSHRDGLCDPYVAKEKCPGIYEEPVKVEELCSEANDCGAVVSPDGKYIVFHSTRPNGYGLADLYVSYKKEDGGWAEPVNLGNKVNTSQLEVIPHFSPDGKYLFFTRRENFSTDKPSKIYWVSTKIIEKLLKH